MLALFLQIMALLLPVSIVLLFVESSQKVWEMMKSDILWETVWRGSGLCLMLFVGSVVVWINIAPIGSYESLVTRKWNWERIRRTRRWGLVRVGVTLLEEVYHWRVRSQKSTTGPLCVCMCAPVPACQPACLPPSLPADQDVALSTFSTPQCF